MGRVLLALMTLSTLAACKGGGGAAAGTSTAAGPGTASGPGESSAASTAGPTSGIADSDGDSSSGPGTGADGETQTDGGTTGGVPQGRPFVYVGGYDPNIRVFELNPDDGALTAVGGPVEAGPSPSFLAADPDGEFLFAVNEVGDFNGESTGSVTSFAIDPATGGLTFVDRVSSVGQGPAHLSTDRSGAWLLVATYTGGNAAVLPIGRAGALGKAVSVQMHGNGAQSHMIMASPANDAVFVPNRALDTVAQYSFDAVSGALTPNAVPTVSAARGAGPRHMDFHPSLDRAYVINEDGHTVVVYALSEAGELSPLQTIGTLPKGVDGAGNSCADIHLHPSGAFAYGSNRGHDSIVTYAVDPVDGTLTLIGHVPTGGQTPRNFEVSPDGTLLLVANQNSDNVVAFSIDGTGLPTATGAVTSVPTPSFVGVVLVPEP